MAKPYAEAFYHSAEWKQCRKSFIAERRAIDGGLCQRCADKPGYIVHHKMYITPFNINNPFVTLDHRNLEYLCDQCHKDEHLVHIKETLCDFDEQGRPIKRECAEN